MAGPFSPGVLITHIRTVLHQAGGVNSTTSFGATKRVVLSGATRRIGVSKGPMRLDFGRFRLLRCFVGGRKVTLSERHVLGDI